MAQSGLKKLCFSLLLLFSFVGCAPAPAIVKDDITLEMIQLFKDPPTEKLWINRMLIDEMWEFAYGVQQYNFAITEFI